MFLVEIRQQNGNHYHPDSVRSIYFGINRYLVEQDATINVFSAPKFLTCRQKVDGYIKKLQSELAKPQKNELAKPQKNWKYGNDKVTLKPCGAIP